MVDLIDLMYDNGDGITKMNYFNADPDQAYRRFENELLCLRSYGRPLPEAFLETTTTYIRKRPTDLSKVQRTL